MAVVRGEGKGESGCCEGGGEWLEAEGGGRGGVARG